MTPSSLHFCCLKQQLAGRALLGDAEAGQLARLGQLVEQLVRVQVDYHCWHSLLQGSEHLGRSIEVVQHTGHSVGVAQHSGRLVGVAQ